jgi:hypothetical protein
MVSAITPGPSAVGPGTVAPNSGGPDTRVREKSAGEPVSEAADTVAARPASWRAARESVNMALADLDLSLAAGKEAATLIARIGEAAREQDEAGVRGLLASLDQLVEGAIEGGATALSGAIVRAQTDPDAAFFEVEGFDLRLRDDGGLTRGASAAGADAAAATATAAQQTLAGLEAALGRLAAAAQKLHAHDGFLGALERSVSTEVRSDIDADGARLLALSVRQGLSQSDAAIANVHSDSVLALFRG